ncbi:MAG: acyl-CoA desaturase [Bacteroidota bacterium]|nr:acyl-CoA desaturase [Bacteroidota bacterium]
MIQQKITFNNRVKPEFASELREKINAYFDQNHLSTFGGSRIVLRAIAMLSMYFVPYLLTLFVPMHPVAFYICYVVMGFGIVGIGCAIQHDANHGAMFENDTLNRLFGFSLDLIGGNSYFWKIKHNVLHHTYTNIHGKDEDISVVQFLRLSPNAPLKPVHRLQHIFAWFAYSTLTFFWAFYLDFPKITRYSGNTTQSTKEPHPAFEIFMLFFLKLLYITYTLVIPIFVIGLSPWMVISGFILMHLIAGLTITTVFQLAHVVEDTVHPAPTSEGQIDNAWFIHQMETTANFATKNKFITWFIGGLNFQVEHHLFPKISSVHYPDINPIVIETAKKYGVPYNEMPTMTNAVVSHYKMLKKFSKE